MEDRVDNDLRSAILQTMVAKPKKEVPIATNESVIEPIAVKDPSKKTLTDLLRESLEIQNKQKQDTEEESDGIRETVIARSRMDLMKDWRF